MLNLSTKPQPTASPRPDPEGQKSDQTTSHRETESRGSRSSLLPGPAELARRYALSASASSTLGVNRHEVMDAVRGDSPRQLVIAGPCSIHDPVAALDYASRLAELKAELKEDLLICMRVYLEKPRTSLGWKGMIHDPHLDGSGDAAFGLCRARQVMRDIAELGLGIATELLDPILAAYLEPLLSWAAIGARSAECQVHRELASAQPFAVGIKNGTDGGLEAAVSGVLSARRPHTRFTVDTAGRAQLNRTHGNPASHVVLRGGHSGPNFSAAHVSSAASMLVARGIPGRVLVDCSHGNSSKDPKRQEVALRSICQQLRRGSGALIGVMLESHLFEGCQSPAPLQQLAYGKSVTDACLGWDDTVVLLRDLASAARVAKLGRRPRVMGAEQDQERLRGALGTNGGQRKRSSSKPARLP
jgi:3-deoxy-7-phosphoheptulonate synthase